MKRSDHRRVHKGEDSKERLARLVSSNWKVRESETGVRRVTARNVRPTSGNTSLAVKFQIGQSDKRLKAGDKEANFNSGKVGDNKRRRKMSW